jgi:hypothetical protein
MDHFDLNAVAWTEEADDGSKCALLEGDKTSATTGFSYLFFLPAGMWDKPHWHTGPSRILVLKGELRLAMGDSFDKAAAKLFPVNSLIHVPKDAVHCDGAEVDTLILGVAAGPWATRYV